MSSAGPGSPVPLLARPGAADETHDLQDGTGTGVPVLRKLRELLRAARGALVATNTQDVAVRSASMACQLLGYPASAVAVRGDNGNFLYCALFGATSADAGAAVGTVLAAEHYAAMRERAQPVEGCLWLRGSFVLHCLPEPRLALPSWCGGDDDPDETPLLWAPMTGEDGGHVGFLTVRCRPGASLPSPAEALLLETLAEITALGLDLERSSADERRYALSAEAERRQLENLISAGLQVRGEAGLDGVLADIARSMVTAVGFARAAIYLADDTPGMPGVQISSGFEPSADAQLGNVGVTLAATVGLTPAEEALLRSFTRLAQFAPLMRPEMRLSRSYLFDHRLFELPASVHDQLVPAAAADDWVDGMWHAEDSLTVPLVDRQGCVLGLISMDEPVDRCLPSREDCRALEFFADQCALAVVESRRLEAAKEEATTDLLTGLANRRAFLERAPNVVHASRLSGSACAALYMDIDRFKDINDSFGHAVGDEVIAAVGHAIAQRLRRGDLVARYGGEEFVALLPGTTLHEAAGLAEAIRKLVPVADLPEVNPPLDVHVSVGVACLRAGDDTAGLLAAADAALYRAKRTGRDRVCLAPL